MSEFKDLSEKEKRLVCAAYAYEIESDPIMSDLEFDVTSSSLARDGTTIPTFEPFTGMWIYKAMKVYGERAILAELEILRG